MPAGVELQRSLPIPQLFLPKRTITMKIQLETSAVSCNQNKWCTMILEHQLRQVDVQYFSRAGVYPLLPLVYQAYC